MTKSELIASIAEKNPHLLNKDIEKIVNTVFSKISTSLIEGNRVEFRGFGTFSVRTRSAREAKNPRTGEKLNVQAKKNVHFKLGKELYEMLNK